jgi:hypothetical protein
MILPVSDKPATTLAGVPPKRLFHSATDDFHHRGCGIVFAGTARGGDEEHGRNKHHFLGLRTAGSA